MSTVRVISAGALAANNLWNERTPVRTGHATTTLVQSGSAVIVIDPGLPAQILAARFGERTNIRPQDVTHVFVTAFTADHLRGADLFPRATRLIHAAEHEAASAAIGFDTDEARRADNTEDLARMATFAALLASFEPMEDTIVPGVDLFPLPGVTPGTCGLIVAQPRTTVVIAGDAVATIDHLEQGLILTGCHDLEKARESLREVLEIADLIVPGRDGLTVNPMQAG